MEERMTSSIMQRKKGMAYGKWLRPLNSCLCHHNSSAQGPSTVLQQTGLVQDTWGPFAELLHLGAAVLWPIKENCGDGG